MNNFDDIIARDVDHLKLDCKPGCAWCCQQLVVLTCRADGEAIIAYCKANMSEDQFEQFKHKVREQAAAIAKLPYEQAESKRWPCPLLVDQQCSVYEIRPIACRSVVSTDSSCCKAMAKATDFHKLSKRHQQLASEIGQRSMRLQISINDQRPIDGAFELRELLVEILDRQGE